MTAFAASLRAVAESLGPRRDAFVEAWARAVRSATAVSAADAAELCAREADALLARLSAGAVAELLADDGASAAQALRAGKSLHPWIVATRVLAPCALSLLETALPDKAAVVESLLALHELSIRRLEAFLRAQEEDGARRLADAEDQAAKAQERAQEASRTNEALRRSEGRSQHRAEQLALLSSVTHRIAGILDPDALMQEAATTIRARMNHTYVAVVLRDEEGALVGRWAGRPGVARESAGRSKGPPKGVIGRSILKRAPQLVADVARDPDYIADVAGTRSEMVVPLIESGEAVGALDFQSEQPAAFDLDDVVAAEVLAEFVIVALRNARLFAARGGE
jgi:GAF domain-containing protein